MRSLKSHPKNHSVLTLIAKNSKNFWNYPKQWMELWNEDLTITEQFIEENNVYHIEDESGKILGFYSYFQEDKNIRLEHLFVEPDSIGKGVGKILINDFFKRIKSENFEKIILDADPHAENFYKKFGFINTKNKPTKIKGRSIPEMIKVNKITDNRNQIL